MMGSVWEHHLEVAIHEEQSYFKILDLYNALAVFKEEVRVLQQQ